MKKIVEFINSIYFIILVNIIAVVFWYLKLPIVAYIIYLVLSIVVILSNANRAAIGAIIMSAIISYQVDGDNYLDFHSLYAKMFIPLGIVVIILFTVDLIRRRNSFKFSPIFYAYLGLLIANIISIINVRDKDIFFIAILGVLQLLGFIIVYVYLYNSQNEGGKKYISYIALITATAITIELGLHYFALGTVDGKLDNDLSWAISNSIAMFYIVLIPIGLYNYFKNQKYFVIVLITGFNFFMMLFMLSRGAYLALAVIIIPTLIMFGYLAKDRKKLLIHASTTFFICLMISLGIGTRLGLIEMVIEYFSDINLFDGSGRNDLFEIGWDLFKKYPILGAGSYSGAYYLKEFEVGTYHNYIMQTIATTGLVGLISLIYLIYTIIKTSVKKEIFNLLFIISFVYILVHGMVDNTFYNPIIMIFLSVTMPYLDKHYENLENLQVKPKMQI